MKERGSVDETILKAETVVLNAETQYMKDLVEQWNALHEERPVEAEQILGEILKESRRTKPPEL